MATTFKKEEQPAIPVLFNQRSWWNYPFRSATRINNLCIRQWKSTFTLILRNWVPTYKRSDSQFYTGHCIYCMSGCSHKAVAQLGLSGILKNNPYNRH